MNLSHAFPGQKAEEKVFLFSRRHWLSFLPNIFISLLMLLLPAILYLLLKHQMPLVFKGEISNYATLALSAYMLFISTFFLISWIDYYFDILIVTNERLVHIEQNGLFNRHISELNLLRIQNVSTEVKGFLPTLFEFGALIVQTAGENSPTPFGQLSSDFTMENISQPSKMAQAILQLHEDLLKKHGQTEASSHGEGELHLPPSDSSSQLNQPFHPEQYNFSEKNSNQVFNKSPLQEIADEGQLKEGEIIDL